MRGKGYYKEGMIALLDEVLIFLFLIFLILYFLYSKSIITLKQFILTLSSIILISSIFLYLVGRTQLKPPIVGLESMMGKRGVVIETLQPSGKIMVEGEIWNATSRDGTIIEKGRQVKVVGMNGMTLTVVEEEKSDMPV